MSAPYRIADFGPSDLLTSDREYFRRLRVDVAETGFFENREFRISEELDIGTGEQLVYKFSSPVDFILQLQALSADTGGIRFTAYRAAQGVEGGTFTPIDIYRVNLMDDAPDYTRQASISSGGTFTTTAKPVEVIRLRTSGSTAQQSTVSGAIGDQRGLSAGDYYLVFTVLGNSASTGTFDLKWEERP